MDLDRAILLATEASDTNLLGAIDTTLDRRSSQEVARHVLLLHEAGLIQAQDFSSLSDLAEADSPADAFFSTIPECHRRWPGRPDG